MDVSCVPSAEPSELSFLRESYEPIAGPGTSDQVAASLAKAHGRQLRVKSSNYASAAPFQPSWAKKARAAVKGTAKLTQQLPHTATYVSPDEIEVVSAKDDTFWSVGTASSAQPFAAASKVTLPCGSISTLQYSHNGDSLAVASHDGSLFSLPVSCNLTASASGHRVVLQAKATAVATMGTGTSASLRMRTPVTCLSWSYYEYSGLDTRLKQPTSAPCKSSSVAASGARYGIATAAGSTAARRPAKKGAGVGSSSSCRLLLGCGGSVASEGDQSAWLWAGTSTRATPVLTLNADTVKGSSTVTPAAAFPGAVTSCCLYYLDRFAVLSSGSAITVCSFTLGQDSEPIGTAAGHKNTVGKQIPQDDLTRLKRRFLGDARACVVSSWTATGDGPAGAGKTSVTHVAAHNTFRSPLLFTACADRSIRVYDVASGSTAAEVVRIPSAHSRSITHMGIPTASTYADLSSPALDCVITASTDGLRGATAGGGPGSNGLVRLWDLRAGVCARQFAGGHSNSRLAIQAALSPDARYLATGSEDRAVVIYDTRSEKVLSKLRGASDAVVSVAWHPRAMHLVAGSLDGGVRAYGPDLVWRQGEGEGASRVEDAAQAVGASEQDASGETYGYCGVYDDDEEDGLSQHGEDEGEDHDDKNDGDM